MEGRETVLLRAGLGRVRREGERVPLKVTYAETICHDLSNYPDLYICVCARRDGAGGQRGIELSLFKRIVSL